LSEEMDSLKLLLPQNSKTNNIAPMTDQFSQIPVADQYNH